MPAGAVSAGHAAASYSYLEDAQPCDLAWEWLRRDPDYRRAAEARRWPDAGAVVVPAAPLASTRRWGCLDLPDAEHTWQDARILWTAALDRSVLKVLALPANARCGIAIDLSHHGSATVVQGLDCEHVLLRAGTLGIRLDVTAGSLIEGPASLVHDLAGDRPVEKTMAALKRFLEFSREDRVSKPRTRSGLRLRREIAALRVHDALALGASIRDVGIMLFGLDRVREEWAGEALKSQCRRLIAHARSMASGGYRLLLG